MYKANTDMCDLLISTLISNQSDNQIQGVPLYCIILWQTLKRWSPFKICHQYKTAQKQIIGLGSILNDCVNPNWVCQWLTICITEQITSFSSVQDYLIFVCHLTFVFGQFLVSGLWMANIKEASGNGNMYCLQFSFIEYN